MPSIINATEETVTIQVAGNYFTWKPGQKKTIRNEAIAAFIEHEKKGHGLAVVPDLMTQAEMDGDIEVSDSDSAARQKEGAEREKEACERALDAYVAKKREIIRNNQVSLARDLARADYKYGPEHEMSDGELEAMRLVSKYDRKGEDKTQSRLAEIEKLKKEIKK